MEKGLKGFFYEYKYYLLPEECSSVEELKSLQAVEVKRLKEELCMAPNFVYESMETELLTIEHPERIFPAEVNLYTTEEYDKILSTQVEFVCKNCERYVDDGTEELNGHHREISLDGVCYLKETEDDFWSFSFCTWVMWKRIAKHSDEMKKWIDKNQQNKLNKLMQEELDRFFLPYVVHGGIDENGNYMLAFDALEYARPGLQTILRMLAEEANREGSSMETEGWKVYPYLPKGMLPVTRKPDYLKHPPRIFMRKNEEEGRMEIMVYEPKYAKASEKTSLQMGDAIYEYLTYHVGQDVLLAGASVYEITSDLPQDMDEVTVEELETALLECALTEEKEVPYPSPLYATPTYEEEPKMLPFKQGVRHIVTTCPEIMPEEYDENLSHENTIYEDFGIIYAYLYLPANIETDEGHGKLETLMWYLSNLRFYPEPIQDSEHRISMAGIGMTIMDESVCADALVFDEKMFFRWMRHLTPVLKELGVKIVTVKRSGVDIYEPNYRIVAEGSGWLN